MVRPSKDRANSSWAHYGRPISAANPPVVNVGESLAEYESIMQAQLCKA